jgi:hypothetical protein
MDASEKPAEPTPVKGSTPPTTLGWPVRSLVLLSIWLCFYALVFFPESGRGATSGGALYMLGAQDPSTPTPSPTPTAIPFVMSYKVGSGSTVVQESENIPDDNDCGPDPVQIANKEALTTGTAVLANGGNPSSHCTVPSNESACFEMQFLGMDLTLPGNLLIPGDPGGGFCADQSSIGLFGVPTLPNSDTAIPNSPEAIGNWVPLFDKLTIDSPINGCPSGSLGISTVLSSSISVHIQGNLDDVVYPSNGSPFACSFTGNWSTDISLNFLRLFPDPKNFDLKQSCAACGASSCPCSCASGAWCSEMYDNASFCKTGGEICSTDNDCDQGDSCIQKSIGQSGCELTSVTNIINYCAATQGSTFTTDPSQLNDALGNMTTIETFDDGPPQLLPDGGYVGDGGVNPDAILNYAASNGVILGYTKFDSTFDSSGQLSSADLERIGQLLDGGTPVILRVKDGGHSVLATHAIRDAGGNVVNFDINDPSHSDSASNVLTQSPEGLYSFDEIASYHVFQCLGSISSPSGAAHSRNLKAASSSGAGAALTIVAGPGLQFIVTDTQGNQTGFDSGTGEVLYNIPGATYDPEFYVDDEDSTAPSTPLLNVFRLALPPNGTYMVVLSATGDTDYRAVFRGFDADGAQSGTDRSGNLANGSSIAYQVQYSSTPGSLITVTQGPVPSATASATYTTTATGTTGATVTPMATATTTATMIATTTGTPTAAITLTPTPTATLTATATTTPTATPTPTLTATPTQTATATPTATSTPTGTTTPTLTATETSTPTPMPTPDGAKLLVPGSISLKPVGIGVGTVSAANLDIKNGGKGGNLLGSVVLNRTGKAISISNPGAFSIPPHSSITEHITCLPDALMDPGTIAISSNDSTRPSANVAVTCAGLAGKLQGPKSVSITGSIGLSASTSFTIQNIGKGVLSGSVGSASSPYSVTSGGGLFGPLQPNGTKTVQVGFTPATKGKAPPGSLTITLDPPGSGGGAVTLKGIGK